MAEFSPNLKSAAYHEAGHVVFGVLAGKCLETVAIGIGESKNAGCATWDCSSLPDGELTLDHIKPSCITFLAGNVVEEWFAPCAANNYSSAYLDLAEVAKLFRRVPNASEEECTKMWTEEIRQSLRSPGVANAVTAVAERLLEDFTLSGEDAAKIVSAQMRECQ